MRSILAKLTIVAAACIAVFLLLGSLLVHPSRVQAAVAAPNPEVVPERLGRVEFRAPWGTMNCSRPSYLPAPRLFLAEDKIWIVLTTFSPEDRSAFPDPEKYRWEIPNVDNKYDWKAMGQVLVVVRQQIQEWNDKHPRISSVPFRESIDMVIAAEDDVRYADLIKAMDMVVARNFEGFSISDGYLETLEFPGPQPFEGWR